jgi:hypothetical protein
VNSGLGLHFSQIEQCSGADAFDTMFNPRHFVKGDRASPGGALRQRGSLRISCAAANQPSTGTFFKGRRGALHDGRNNTATRSGNTVHNENNFEIERSNVEFASCGTVLKGVLLTPKGKREALPTIVLARGMSGVKEGSIMKYAEHFARGGFAVLAYDNINFGDSGGEPRQEVDPALPRRGYRDAITYVNSRPDVDKTRVGIFVTSFRRSRSRGGRTRSPPQMCRFTNASNQQVQGVPASAARCASRST